jgi:hypothetical protein
MLGMACKVPASGCEGGPLSTATPASERESVRILASTRPAGALLLLDKEGEEDPELQ